MRLVAASLTIAVVFAAMLGAAQAQPAPAGNTIESAIVLPGVTSEAAGTAAEYGYIRKNLPGWNPGTQALLSHNGRQYDSIELTGPDGAQQTIFFDITAWFGK